jgi:hypothetical protein
MIRRLSICFPPKQEHNGTSVSYLLRREAWKSCECQQCRVACSLRESGCWTCWFPEK